MEHKVVAHFKDGRLLKGLASDPDPSSGHLHVKLPGDGSDKVEVPLESLKGVFFVKSWEGNSAYVERAEGFGESSPNQSGAYPLQRTVVGFQDGERMKGYSYNYSPDQPALQFFPYDPFGNNYKILIVCSALCDLEIW
ncbi:MAG: hypothetical protein V3U86_13250 [Acidobacteriota bacterium]|nr:hypothetical protein [Acidobacteriota bacterium]